MEQEQKEGMDPAGRFRYHPAFTIDEDSVDEILEFDDIQELVDSGEICRTIIDYEFDDVDAQVIYGEVGPNPEETAKFFMRTVFDEDGALEEAKMYVPDDQENYPAAAEFFQGMNHPEKEEFRAKYEKVQSIAHNFRDGNIIILDLDELIEQQKEQQEEEE